MIDLKKVMKGLRIEIDKYNAKISGKNWVRPNIEYIAKNKHADYDYGTLQVIGARVILAAMDEYEEPKLDPDSDCPHGHFVHACSICTKPAEPKPAWEPGTVLKTEDWFECDDCFKSIHPANHPEKVKEAKRKLREGRSGKSNE